MIITYELNLRNFKAWSGGKDTLNRVINEGKVDALQSMLEELYPDGMTDTQLNDILWFESDWIYENLGIRTYDQIQEEIEEKEAKLEDLKEELEEELGFANADDEEILDIEERIEELKDEITELKEELKNI